MSAARSDIGDPGRPASGPHIGWTDQRLVGACVRGDERAWSILVEKYKSLVYSIAIKYGAPPDEAADLFQTVWVDVYKELDGLRKQGSVRSWLISVTRHKCYHWRQRHQREAIRKSGIAYLESDDRLAVEPVSLDEMERDQMVREAIFTLPERCRELIQLLFYSQPPLRHREVAQQLGLAIGSIGFIRGRCLKLLQRSLEKQGLA
jgi:RNA polymerase sigma factor (sigma-70 family)